MDLSEFVDFIFITVDDYLGIGICDWTRL